MLQNELFCNMEQPVVLYMDREQLGVARGLINKNKYILYLFIFWLYN